MGDTAPNVLTEIRGDWNSVKIKKQWTQFANFTFEIKRHGFEVKTKAYKIILDCRMIKHGGEFTILFDSGDFDSESNFFKVFNQQKPMSLGIKVDKAVFRTGNVLKNITTMDDVYKEIGEHISSVKADYSGKV